MLARCCTCGLACDHRGHRSSRRRASEGASARTASMLPAASCSVVAGWSSASAPRPLPFPIGRASQPRSLGPRCDHQPRCVWPFRSRLATVP